MKISDDIETYTELHREEDGSYKISYRTSSKINMWTVINLKFSRADVETIRPIIAKRCARSERETLAILDSLA